MQLQYCIGLCLLLLHPCNKLLLWFLLSHVLQHMCCIWRLMLHCNIIEHLNTSDVLYYVVMLQLRNMFLIMCLIAIAIMHYMSVVVLLYSNNVIVALIQLCIVFVFCVLLLWIALMLMCNNACVLQSPICIALIIS